MAKWYLGTAFIIVTTIGVSVNAASAQTIIDRSGNQARPSPPLLR